MTASGTRPSVRVAEIVGALSLGIDLGFGQPMEHVLRQCLIALRLAERAGLAEEARATVYYTALLLGVGCHTDAHEQAKWFGDDIAFKSTKYDHELRSIRGMAAGMRKLGSGNPPVHRFRIGLEFVVSGHRDVNGMIAQHAAMARALAEQLGLSDDIVQALDGSYEMWDGKGWPRGIAGDAIPNAARIAQLAEFLEVAYRVGGVDRAGELARKRSGRQFDPALCAIVLGDPEALFAGLDAEPTWDAVIAAEPALQVLLIGEQIDSALGAIATVVDLKTPFMLGHAQAVAELGARAAAEHGRLEQAPTLRRAGLVHGLGRLGVSNSIWDKPGPLGPGEWERVRLHPYLTQRMLRQSPALAQLGEIVVQLRERLDGSGYPAGLSGAAISPAGRLLGAADAYQAMREPRPYRPALTAEAAAAQLREEVAAGRLDADAVEAVLGAAGHRIPRRRGGPSGLTAREVDVLRLLAYGYSNKEIARRLVISPKTVGNHVEHIYAKIDASTRAGASLFAIQHGLLPEEAFAAAAPL